MHVLRGLWRRSSGTEQCRSLCMRNSDSLPGGIVGLLLSAVPTVQTVWRSFHRDWITEDFCSVFFGIIESTEGAWFLCLMIWRWRQEPAGLCQSYGHAQHRLQKKSNSHKTLQGWIAYLNIKDLLSLNHLTRNHINCILEGGKKKRFMECLQSKNIFSWTQSFQLFACVCM